jgi:hypothetical protein
MKTEEELCEQWQAMKKRHAEALAKLQADNHMALVQLLAEHFAERDELKKLLKTVGE